MSYLIFDLLLDVNLVSLVSCLILHDWASLRLSKITYKILQVGLENLV